MPTKTIERKSVRSFALLVVSTLLAAVCAWSVWLQGNVLDKSTSIDIEMQDQSGRFDRLEEAMDAILHEQEVQSSRIQALESASETQRLKIERIVEIERAVTGQRDILHAALGHVLPMTMPSAWEERLAALEEEASDPESWPRDAEQSEEFMDALAELITEMSPLAEEQYFPQVVPLRWSAIAFEAMHRQPGENETYFSIAEQLRSISDAKPAGMDSNLEQRLRQRAEEHENRAEEHAIDEILHEARWYLDDPETDPRDESSPEASIDEIYDALGIYAEHPTRKDDINSKRRALEDHIRTMEAQALADTFRERWNTAKVLADENAAVYESAATMLVNEITVARNDAALNGMDTSNFAALAREVQNAVNAMQDRRRRGYQEWALGQIMRFEVARTMIKERPRDESESDENDGFFCQSLPELFCSNWTAKKYREIQEAIVTYLLPVDQA